MVGGRGKVRLNGGVLLRVSSSAQRLIKTPGRLVTWKFIIIDATKPSDCRERDQSSSSFGPSKGTAAQRKKVELRRDSSSPERVAASTRNREGLYES